MQILLGQDLEDHRDRDDRHDLRGEFAEVGAENDVGDMGGNDGEAEAGRQRDAEQQFGAFGKMRRTAASPLLAWICTAIGKNAAAALIAGIISVCRTRSRPATYFPASAAPTRLAIMKRSVTLEIASSVSDSVSGRPCLRQRPAGRRRRI